jgi:UDP-N-acetylmuramate--alanine ligase
MTTLASYIDSDIAADYGRPSLVGRRFHFVGIGGAGMRGLAEVVLRRGGSVSGSDREAAGGLVRLKQLGASLFGEQKEGNVPADADAVVVSAAVKDDNPEVQAARRMGLRVIKYAKMLGLVMRMHKGLAIAGTHGKSTTTGLTAYILASAGLSPTFVCGAQIPQLGGGARVGDGDWFVAESCEYDRSFHNLHPTAAAILNVEEDHLDCYRDLAEIIESFRTFAARVPEDGLLVINGEDHSALRAVQGLPRRIETFGESETCAWRATQLESRRGVYDFDVHYRGRPLGRFRMNIPGLHHVYNGLAAMALSHFAGVGTAQMREALADYSGADRRLTLKGNPADVTVVDDYGHHPTEVQATLKAAREYYRPRRLWCIFQPHQHSRTRHLMNDFARSFRAADRVVVPDIYFVRDSIEEAARVDSREFVRAVRAGGADAEYIPEFDRIVEHVGEQVKPGDCVITMGAGNIWMVADELVRRLQLRR